MYKICQNVIITAKTNHHVIEVTYIINVHNKRQAYFVLFYVVTRQLPTFIGKKHYDVGKKLPLSVLHDTQILYFNPLILRLEHLSLVENTEARSFPKPQTGNLQILFNLATYSNYSITNYVKIPVFHFIEKVNKGHLRTVNFNY